MPEKINLIEKLELIHVKSDGHIITSDLADPLNKASTLYKNNGFKFLLVDASNEKSLPDTPDLYTFAIQVASNIARMKVAIVYSYETKSDLEFIANVASNRGALIKIFKYLDDALTYLLGFSNDEIKGLLLK